MWYFLILLTERELLLTTGISNCGRMLSTLTKRPIITVVIVPPSVDMIIYSILISVPGSHLQSNDIVNIAISFVEYFQYR